MSNDLVLYDSKDRIATITLNRPDKLNALSNSLVAELRDAFIHLEQSDDRVAIVTGAGDRAFSAGADLRDPPRDPELWECMPGVGVPLTKPTIAVVAGHCVGGACCLVQFSSLAIAADNADFSYPEAQIGFCGGLIASLAVRIPYKVAMELMLTGAHMKAQRAYEVGMVNAVVPLAQRNESANEYAASWSKARRWCSDCLRLSPARRFCRAARRSYKPSPGAICCGSQNPGMPERAAVPSPKSASRVSRGANFRVTYRHSRSTLENAKAAGVRRSAGGCGEAAVSS